MSDLSVITTSNAPAPPSHWAQRKALFDQLGQALQAGDLQAAQDAFAALRPPAPDAQGAGNPPRGPFSALTDALQKGDLVAAQEAFAQITQRREHRHHRTEEVEHPEAEFFKQMKALFQQLGQALEAGDLAGAQEAFADLKSGAPGDGPGRRLGRGGNGHGPFATLANALENGDLAAAQEAFGQIQQARGHRHHRHEHDDDEGATTPPTPTTPPTTDPAPASSTPPAPAPIQAGDQEGNDDEGGAKSRRKRIDLTA
ncbi:MAG: hypothetical protein WAS25_06820 [Geothrix sp.]|uniref:hypothetical protein n=1 Tax=Geothrix sp. TaxID=1962974 RepID=UPI003BAE913A